ncbi:MAG: Holliday junction resolvase RuvX [Acidimicrobiia bacterium]|nr:Holliday junction resolvase RuvX [Acidimicrobiia bacterium]
MKRYLALDIGKKRTGLALVNDETKVATPLLVIAQQTESPIFIEELYDQIIEFEIDSLIAGVPVDLKGHEGIAAKDVRSRVESLLKRLNSKREKKNLAKLVVVYVDERLSTAQAEKALKSADVSSKNRKNMRDAHAAMVIAQSYIDSL